MLDIVIKSMRYNGQKEVLRNVKLSFPSKGLYCVVGESGTGKSSLLNCLTGIQEFDGELKYRGVVVNHSNTEQFRNQEVSMVFQDYKLVDELSVIDNVEISASLTGKTFSKKQVSEILKRLGLEHLQDKKAKLLSGGEKQRVAIARAILKDSSIVVADEPTGNLDSKNSQNICELLKEIAKEKLVIMVTHDMSLAQQFATKIITIKDGVVDSDGVDWDKTTQPQQWTNSSNSVNMTVQQCCKLAFMKKPNVKSVIYLLLTILLSIITIVSGVFVMQDKYALSERYLKQDGNNLVIAEYKLKNEKVYLDQVESDFAKFLECEWKVLNPLNLVGDKYFDRDDNIGKIYHCVELGENDDSIEWLWGDCPTTANQVAISNSIARAMQDDISQVVGSELLLSTGDGNRVLTISGIFDDNKPALNKKYANLSEQDYQDLKDKNKQHIDELVQNRNDCFLSRAVVLASNTIENWRERTNMDKVDSPHNIIANFGGFSINVYNQKYMANMGDISDNSVVISPALKSLVQAMSSSDYFNKKLVVNISKYNSSDTVRFDIQDEYNGFGGELAMCLSDKTYQEYFGGNTLFYDGLLTSKKNNIREVYKELLPLVEHDKCNIYSNYLGVEFLESVTTIEFIRLYIALPIVVIFAILSSLSAYATSQYIVGANVKNYTILRVLGIDKKHFLSIAIISISSILVVSILVSLLVGGAICIIINNLGIFVPSVAVFSGVEVAIVYVGQKIYNIPILTAYRKGNECMN